MTLLLIVLLCVIGCFWIFVRFLRWINKKLLFWLVWTFGGLVLLLWLPTAPSPATRLIVQAWVYSIYGLPVWWLFRWVWKRYAPSTQGDNHSDLKPIVDEQGKQVFP